MDYGSHIYTTGFWWGVGLTAFGLMFALSLVGIGVFVYMKSTPSYMDIIPPWLSSLLWIIFGGVVAVLIAGAWFPFDMDYHARVPVTGVVSESHSRMVSTGNGMEEKFVIKFEDSGQEFGCLDTRCATIKPGDTLSLLCTKQYDWNSTDGWDCGWGSNQSAP